MFCGVNENLIINLGNLLVIICINVNIYISFF